MKLPKTTITLSFLLVLLVIAGMTIKSQMDNAPQPIADSLMTKPELISRLPYYAKAVGVTSIEWHSGVNISKRTDSEFMVMETSTGIIYKLKDQKWIAIGQDTIPNFFPNHSEIPTR